jgi:uncharacterized alpha-E superfamily protein
MLSRTAERMYWFGRYVERAENTARLISVNTNLILDMPGINYIWHSLVDISGYREVFHRRFTVEDERNVIRFLLNDEECSLTHSVRMARENARTSREIMPNEAWHKINELHIYLNNNTDAGLKRVGRHKFLQDIINQCQETTGYLAGCMSNDVAYSFIKLGRNLERADMTTRILDVGCVNLLDPDHAEIVEHEDILWMNVLHSLTAYQMYRQHVKDRVNGEDVVSFLLTNKNFPRAVAHCLSEVTECFNRLPNADHPLRQIGHSHRSLLACNAEALLRDSELHAYIDEIQLDLADLHGQIATTWFGHNVEDVIQE